MSFAEVVLLGVALSMDAFAVTISNMFAYRDMSHARSLLMPVFFGAFQGIMPLAGYFAGSFIASLIERYSGIVTFVILGFIGAKMIWGVVRSDAQGVSTDTHMSVKLLFFQAVATSIDAFAVGVSFVAMSVEPLSCSAIIACTTFLCTLVALVIGRTFGNKLGEKATIVGGIVLIAIGLKALI